MSSQSVCVHLSLVFLFQLALICAKERKINQIRTKILRVQAIERLQITVGNLNHSGIRYPNAITACCCFSPSDKCNKFQESCCQMKLTASKKDARCDYRLCVQENARHSAQQKTLYKRNECSTSHSLVCELTNR